MVRDIDTLVLHIKLKTSFIEHDASELPRQHRIYLRVLGVAALSLLVVLGVLSLLLWSVFVGLLIRIAIVVTLGNSSEFVRVCLL